MHAGAYGDQKKVLVSLELEFIGDHELGTELSPVGAPGVLDGHITLPAPAVCALYLTGEAAPVRSF